MAQNFYLRMSDQYNEGGFLFPLGGWEGPSSLVPNGSKSSHMCEIRVNIIGKVIICPGRNTKSGKN